MDQLVNTPTDANRRSPDERARRRLTNESAVDTGYELRNDQTMATYEVECPMCESTDYASGADGTHECYVCNTSWGSEGRKQQATQQNDFAKKVNEKLGRYTQR